MDKLRSILLILCSSIFILTGCTSVDDNFEIDNNNNIVIDDNNNNNMVIDDNNDDEVYKDNSEDDETKNEQNEICLNISSLDSNTEEKIVLGTLKMDNSKSIEEKLNLLLKEISAVKFENASINLVKVEDNIAYVDLNESSDKNYWSNNYFQGSTGGNITTYTLIESILQREYNGEWISGVYFTYEGKTDIEFDHVGIDFFGSIIKR